MILIKAVLANIPIYFMSLFNVPKLVALKFEELLREFLWKGGENSPGMHLIVWDIFALQS